MDSPNSQAVAMDAKSINGNWDNIVQHCSAVPKTLLMVLLFATNMQAQQVQWLTSSAIGYDMSPTIPPHLVCASDADHAYLARSLSLTYLYDAVYGKAVVEQRNAQGGISWSFTLGDSVLLQAMAAAPDGSVIIGGRFFRALHVGDGPVLPVVNGDAFPETFLIALDINGTLLWQRNITPNDPQGTMVQSITFDAQGQAWYAACDFFSAQIVRLDGNGNATETRTITGAKTIGSISFDPWGGLYFSGSAESPGITVGAMFFPVPGTYNMIVGRYKPNGQPHWLQVAEDVTFQRPWVKADAYGHAYFTGSPIEPMNFDGFQLHGPEWNSTFFLAHVDSTGHFEWVMQPPLGAPFSGQFALCANAGLGVDALGNGVVLGTANGVVNWGNGVVTGVGALQNSAVVMLQVDSMGVPQWQLHSDSKGYDLPAGLSVLPDGICHLAVQVRDTFHLGTFQEDTTTPHVVFARINPDVVTGCCMDSGATSVLSVFPSPCTEGFNVAVASAGRLLVKVFDSRGRKVLETSETKQLGAGLVPGVYQVEVLKSGEVLRGRVIKL